MKYIEKMFKAKSKFQASKHTSSGLLPKFIIFTISYRDSVIFKIF